MRLVAIALLLAFPRGNAAPATLSRVDVNSKALDGSTYAFYVSVGTALPYA